jgi:hypothetical protein
VRHELGLSSLKKRVSVWGSEVWLGLHSVVRPWLTKRMFTSHPHGACPTEQNEQTFFIFISPHYVCMYEHFSRTARPSQQSCLHPFFPSCATYTPKVLTRKRFRPWSVLQPSTRHLNREMHERCTNNDRYALRKRKVLIRDQGNMRTVGHNRTVQRNCMHRLERLTPPP